MQFEDVYKIQRDFTSKFLLSHGITLPITDEVVRRDWNKEYILHLLKEASGLLDNIDWKMHDSSYCREARSNLLEDCVDIMKYVIGLMIVNNFTVDEIQSEFLGKSEIVKLKFEQFQLIKKLKDNEDKIVVVDIDGIISDHPDCFIDFFNKVNHTSFDNVKDVKMQVAYEDTILQYRTSGHKTSLLVRDGIHELLSALRNTGYFIILLTARPYERIHRIYRDTVSWLVNNDIIYDAIIWNKDKARLITDNFDKSRIVFCIDDDLSNVNEYSKHGIKNYFMINKKAYRTMTDMIAVEELIDAKHTMIVYSIEELHTQLLKEGLI